MDGSLRLPAVDEGRLEEFTGKVMGDMAGALAVLLAHLGEQTGIYRALRDHGPADAATLAEVAGVDARYLTEWLSAQAAAGYVTYDTATAAFSLTPEQAIVLTQEGHPAFAQGSAEIIVAQFERHETAEAVLRSGRGRGWDEHAPGCFCGMDRFFRPGYVANLVEHWLPALDGVTDKLRQGAKVADVGCGHGSTTVLLAEHYPASEIHGFDFHAPSIEAARAQAAEAGVGRNTRFETVSAKDLPADRYDLVCIFDALHDMGDPVGAARRIRECLKPDGTLMLVEPLAGDRLEDNLHLLGQLFYAGSTLICTPCSRAQEVGLALGAQAGEARLTAVLKQAGFSSVRRAAETQTNMVLEARP